MEPSAIFHVVDNAFFACISTLPPPFVPFKIAPLAVPLDFSSTSFLFTLLATHTQRHIRRRAVAVSFVRSFLFLLITICTFASSVACSKFYMYKYINCQSVQRVFCPEHLADSKYHKERKLE